MSTTVAPGKEASAPDIYLPQTATITDKSDMTAVDTFYRFKMDSGKDLGHKAGQFVEISLPGIGEAPISISSSPTRKGLFEMVIRRLGNVTNALYRLQVGDKVGIRGPYGTTFPVEGALKGKDILFVGGGCGLVPLRSAIQYVMDNRKDYGRVIILSGCRTPADRQFPGEGEQWRAQGNVEFLETVDQGTGGWQGHVGVITTLFSKITLGDGQWTSLVCGPPVMYKFVIKELKKLSFADENIYVSLERRMKCGLGKCGHCQVNGVYACQDGPVFRLKDILDIPEAL